MHSLLAAAALPAQAAFDRPTVDWHAFAPELVLTGTIVVLLLVDLISSEVNKWAVSSLAGIGVLASILPVLSLADDGGDRVLFGGAYVVDDFSLVLKFVFLATGWAVILLATNYIAEGDYWEGEFYVLLLSSLLGMTVMASARDLVSIFVALELLSIPAYLLAAWRKRDAKSNEAGLKYYLMGVFATAVMLYGMSLLYGVTGTTLLARIGAEIGGSASAEPLVTLAIVLIVVGFGFKVSAVPFHTWAPDVYEGAPTPVTAFLAVASKTAGFVALLQLVFVGFYGRADVVEPLMWALAALSMTVGNLVALRQTNVVRMLAYSGIAQAGYMLAPLAVVSHVGDAALHAIVGYLAIYAAMNIGAFAVVLAAARRTGSAELSSFNGLFSYAPNLAVPMSIFLFSLAGIPPLGGWFAKFQIFFSIGDAGTRDGYVLMALVGLNSVIALYYYARIAKAMWFEPVPEGGDTSPIRLPISLATAIAVTVVVTVVIGILPQLVGEFTDKVAFAIGS